MTRAPKPFISIGHRGAAGHAPENTLLAFETGIKLGAHCLEFDVQLHGETLLIFHDDRVERTTNGKGRLLDLPLDTVRQLDAGQGQRIPTLDETLDCIGSRAEINIELKTANGTAAKVAEVLKPRIADGRLRADKLLVSSFNLRELAEFKIHLPEIALGALYCGVPLNLAGDAKTLGAKAVNLASDFLDPALIADAKKLGCAVYVYTVNHADDIQLMRDLGVDGVFSDFPERALSPL